MAQYKNMTSPGGIIHLRISDHLFFFLLASKLGTPKFMDARHHTKRRINSREAYNAFLADLQANDTTDSPNQDPDCDLN